MTDTEQQGARLKELISALKITQSAMAQRIGVTRGYLSILVSGEKPLSQKVLNGITTRFPRVNMNWLLNGNGDMFLPKDLPPEPGILTGVMEAPASEYERNRSLRVEELPEVLLNLQAEVLDLRDRVVSLEDMVRQIVATYKRVEPPKD